jgi:hypothetical protein
MHQAELIRGRDGLAKRLQRSMALLKARTKPGADLEKVRSQMKIIRKVVDKAGQP